MQWQLVAAVDEIIRLPLVRGPVAARGEQPMQHRQEHGPLHGKLEPPRFEHLFEHLPATALFPEPFEDQGRAEAADANDRQAAALMLGEQQHLVGEAGTGTQESIELAGGLELLELAQGGEHLLAAASRFPAVFDDLEVGAGPGLFDAEEHGALHSETP